MREDEFGAIEISKKCREDIARLIVPLGGLFVEAPSDNLVADFSNLVSGIECRLEIRKELKAKDFHT